MAKKRTVEVQVGSGNVFADLGLPNAEQELLKAALTLQIYRVLRARKLTQAKAGKVPGIPQPHVSALMNGRGRAFSAERLMEFLVALRLDVEIRVKPARKAPRPDVGRRRSIAASTKSSSRHWPGSTLTH